MADDPYSLGFPSPADSGAVPDPARRRNQPARSRPCVAVDDRAGEGRLPAWSGSPSRRSSWVARRRQGGGAREAAAACPAASRGHPGAAAAEGPRGGGKGKQTRGRSSFVSVSNCIFACS